MCPICRNRVEYNIKSVIMYKHKNRLGYNKEIEEKYPITTAAIVTTINPLVCNHLENTDKRYQPEKMIPVPEWVPSLVDKLVEEFPDIYNINLPSFNISENYDENSSCKLHISFDTNDTECATRFIWAANMILDKNIDGYRTLYKIKIHHSKFDACNDKNEIIHRNTISITAPSVNFMESNKGDAIAFYSFIEKIMHFIYQFEIFGQIHISEI